MPRPYNPGIPPARDEWLATDETLRLELVGAYHLRERTPLPSARLHAAIHLVVENQVAMGEMLVVDTLARLQAEGLSRHEALHAIGSVLADRIVEALRGDVTSSNLPERYLEGLRSLTATTWKHAD